MKGRWMYSNSAIEEGKKIAKQFALSYKQQIDTFVKDVFESLDNLSLDLNVLVLYHSDLDGNMSALATVFWIESMLDKRKFHGDYGIKFRRINYNYDLNAGHDRLDSIIDDIDAADVVFIVDYSLRADNPQPHMEQILKYMDSDHCNHALEDGHKNIVWIDHHLSSTIEPKDEKCKALREKFLECSHHLIVPEIKGLSATLICNTVANTFELMMNEDALIDIPDLFIFTSLYDTFHPAADIDFYYGINQIEYDMQNITEESWLSTNMELSSYLKDITKYLYIDSPESCLYKLMENGELITNYADKSNEKYRSGCMFHALAIYNDTVYDVAVINGKGNSFLFGDDYYDSDGVILFYFNKYGTYTYSLFADTNNPDKDLLLPCNKIAEEFGGGGHSGAAGFTTDCNIFEKYMEKNTAVEIDSYPYIIDFNKVIDSRKKQ